jgi:hypothetical protein
VLVMAGDGDRSGGDVGFVEGGGEASAGRVRKDDERETGIPGRSA